MVDALEAALGYAGRGWLVFPVEPGGKRRLGRLAPHGVHDSTLDEPTIRRWWSRPPYPSIGLATGLAFDVLDIDGRDGYTNLDQTNPTGEGIYGPTVRTGRGWQVYVAPTGKGNATRVGGLTGIDWRGHGGYVVAPPSIHPNGKRYRWCTPSWAGPDAPIEPAPSWLVNLLQRPVDEPFPPTGKRPLVRSTGNYWSAAVERACGRIAVAPVGQRNHQLNAEAYGLARLIAGGTGDLHQAGEHLLVAGCRAGLDQQEAEQTIASGFRAGVARPRSVA